MRIHSRKKNYKNMSFKEHVAESPSEYTEKHIKMSSWSSKGGYFNVTFGMDGRWYELELTPEEAHDIVDSLNRAFKDTKEYNERMKKKLG